MSDYIDEEVSGDANELGVLIKLRLGRSGNKSVQVFKKGRKWIVRTWRIEFEVEGAEGMNLSDL